MEYPFCPLDLREILITILGEPNEGSPWPETQLLGLSKNLVEEAPWSSTVGSCETRWRRGSMP